MYTKVPCGPTAYFDCDDTLIMWDRPEELIPDIKPYDDRLIEITCRGKTRTWLKNKYNIDLLIKMAERGHGIVVFSGGGADWAEAIVNALGLDDLVDVVSGKPTYFIDDIADPRKWMGKHGYFDINGKRVGHQMVHEIKDNE